MIGVTGLDLLAFPLRHASCRIVCAIDAGRGELFHAAYRHSPGGVQRLTEPAVSAPADLAAELEASDGETLLVGDGALRHCEQDRKSTRMNSSHECASPLPSSA